MFSSAAATGLLREAGLRLPGNGCPVDGSMTAVGSDEKSPPRNATDGTTAVVDGDSTRVMSSRSTVPKKKVRFRSSRPPRLAPTFMFSLLFGATLLLK